jgi:hypothetical protein
MGAYLILARLPSGSVPGLAGGCVRRAANSANGGCSGGGSSSSLHNGTRGASWAAPLGAVRVGVSGFGERYVQLPLWEDDEEQVPHHPTS